MKRLLRSYPERTDARIAQLGQFMRDHLLEDGTFKCRHHADCLSSRKGYTFYEGQLSHVGSHYDLEIDGDPMRVVVVGQEYGHNNTRVNLSARSKMILESAAGGFRRRNPHMKGTTLTLLELLGLEFDAGGGSEMLDEKIHIFDAFALVNFLLCSALETPRPGTGPEFTGGGQGRSSAVMRRNCSEYFIKTLEILEPTVVVLQGKGTRSWVASALGLAREGQIVERVAIGRMKDVMLFSLTHPSAHEPFGYRSTKSPYFTSVARPALQAARQEFVWPPEQ